MKPIMITLLYLTAFGDIKLDSFEIHSSCESWYHYNVKVNYLVITTITNTKVNKLLDIYVMVMNHNNLE